MQITIDTGNVYVMLAIIFCSLWWTVSLALQVKIVLQKRQLLKQREPSAQLEASLQVIDNLVDFIEGMTIMMARFGVKSEGSGLPEQAREFAAKLRRDAGL